MRSNISWRTVLVLCVAAAMFAIPAGPVAAQTTYIWDNSNVTGTPVSPLNWFTGAGTLGLWTDSAVPVSSNANTIQFFANTSTALTNTATPSAQTSNINNGGAAFQLGALTLSGLGSATANANLTMTISGNTAGDALNFSAAAGTINLDAVNATRIITYNVNSAIQLGTASSAGALTITGNGTGTFNIGGAISELQIGGGSLIKSGSSTVTLSGTNTYTGATTVNSGTLQISNAGALNHTAGNITINNGGIVSSAVANCLNQETITVNTGGFLTATRDLANAYTGSTIYLDGGTLRYEASGSLPAPGTTIDVGGTVVVRASSTLNPYGSSVAANNKIATLVFGTLDFTADGYLLTVSKTGTPSNKPAYLTSKFVGSTISHSGTIGVNAARTYVELTDTAIRAGKTLTKTGVEAFTVSGNLGVAMLGGAELMSANSFTMIAADTTFTNTSTFGTSGGLWSVSGATSPITATLANNAGTIGGSVSGVSFAAEDAAFVSLTGLSVSTPYDLFLKLADPDKQATVMTQLGKNPAFTIIAAYETDQVQFKFTAPATTSYFAWDNYHTTGDWYLGGNLTYVGLSAWAPPAAKDCLWVGGSGGVKWSLATDWDQTPAATDTLIFGTAGGGGAVLDNDIVEGSFSSLQFQSTAPAFTLGGYSVTLTGKGDAKVIILNDSAVTQIVNLPIALGANGMIDAASGNIVAGGDISGDFSLTKIGAGTLTISGASNTYGGGTIINAGAVVIDNTTSGTAKLGAAGKNLTLNGGSLDLGGTSQTVGALSVTAAAGIGDTISNGNLTATSYDVSATGDVAISANLLVNGSAGLAKSGAGILTLSGSGNTYAGATTISEGTLKLGVANAIPHGLGKGDVAVGGALDLNGLNQTVNGLTGAGAVTNSNLAAATLTVGDADKSSSFPGAINDGIGAIALEKIGTGTVTLSGTTNGYTGGTTISAGALQFNSAAAIGGSGRDVTVADGVGAAVAAGYAIDNAFLNRLAENENAFTVALGFASSNALNLSSTTGATLPNASLGANGTFTYSGVLTPNGTTYRLGGGGGILTVSSQLTDSRTLVVRGPGTVILSGTANTFTGDTTVNSGTLQINHAGALNHTAGNVTINSGGIVLSAAANCLNQEEIYVKTGGSLTSAQDLANAYTGSTIYLDGGTLRYEANGAAAPGNTINVGGTVVVRASSTLNPYGSSTAMNNKLGTLVFGTLDFTADGYLLTVSNTGTPANKPAYLTSKFVGSTISHSGTIGVDAARTYVELTDTAIRAGKTLTQTGTQAFTVSGSLGVAMLGGAEVLGASSFDMITAASTTFTNTSTFDTSGGLWSVSGITSPITATLDNSKGSSALGGSGVSFAAEDAAYVSLTGLTEGSKYDLFLELANPDDLGTVMDQLGKNPDFSSVTSTGAGKVQFKFTAPEATSYFAWDNVHTTAADWYLGGDLTYVGLSTSAVPGDTNGDKVVDAADFITLKKNFGQSANSGPSYADFNKSGTTDWTDLNTLTNAMGATGGGAPATTPEPATLGLLMVGALAVIRRRRK
jgi:autotransporter-associated beta strand protein